MTLYTYSMLCEVTVVQSCLVFSIIYFYLVHSPPCTQNPTTNACTQIIEAKQELMVVSNEALLYTKGVGFHVRSNAAMRFGGAAMVFDNIEVCMKSMREK